MSNILIEESIGQHGRPRYQGIHMDYDWAGNLFVGAAWYTGDPGHADTGELRLWRVESGTLRVSYVGAKPMTSPYKGDGATFLITPDGRIWPGSGGHYTDPNARLELLEPWTGVAVGATPGQPDVKKTKAAFVVPEGGPTGMTIQELTNVLRDPSSELRSAFIGISQDALADDFATVIRNDIPKTIAALRDAHDPAKRTDDNIKQYQDEIFVKLDQDLFLAINKHITGQDPRLPVHNQPFIDLIKRCIREVLAETR